MKRTWPLIIVIVGTIGILSYIVSDAFYSELENPIHSVRLFRYFTIQSNLIAIIYFWMLYAMRLNMKYRWFDRFIGGVAIYLFVTFVIYAVMLEGSFENNTLDWIGNISLHYLNPFLVIGFYIYYRNEYRFETKDILIWIAYPLIYLLFLVLHGVLTEDYLYSFFQVNEVGWVGFASMSVVLLGVFLGLSFILVKIVSKKE